VGLSFDTVVLAAGYIGDKLNAAPLKVYTLLILACIESFKPCLYTAGSAEVHKDSASGTGKSKLWRHTITLPLASIKV